MKNGELLCKQKLIKVVNNKTLKGRFASQIVTMLVVWQSLRCKKARCRLTCIMFTDFAGNSINVEATTELRGPAAPLSKLLAIFSRHLMFPSCLTGGNFPKISTQMNESFEKSMFSSLLNAYCGYDGVRSHLCQLQ